VLSERPEDAPFPNSALTTLNSPLKDRDAKAELNRRSQACEVLTGTGIRVAEKAWGKCRVESAKCRMRKGRRFTLHSSFFTPHFFGIPCWNCTSLCGFANRGLDWFSKDP
jgi:hypothetical protein